MHIDPFGVQRIIPASETAAPAGRPTGDSYATQQADDGCSSSNTHGMEAVVLSTLSACTPRARACFNVHHAYSSTILYDSNCKIWHVV